MLAKELLYDWAGANVHLFTMLNGIRGERIDQFMLLGTRISDHSNFSVYLAAFVLFALHSAHRAEKDGILAKHICLRRSLAAISVFILAYVLDGALVGWLKSALDFPRPLTALSAAAVHVVGQPEYLRALPSGHASFSFVLAASAWPALNMWCRIAAVLFVLWVGLSRVNVGAHFPADVVAGWLMALAVVLVVRALVGRVL